MARPGDVTGVNPAARAGTGAAATAAVDASFPAYSTCKAGRPDHGSNGAYPSWPAFALEALCYLDGNCSSAFSIMSTFADNTREGPFGQAHEVPQLETPPYTPFDAERAFKPVAGVNRYIAIEGGSFFDATLRGFFGYNPPMAWAPPATASAASAGGQAAGRDVPTLLRAALREPDTPRGFIGRLRHLRTPLGLATISSGVDGLSIVAEQ